MFQLLLITNSTCADPDEMPYVILEYLYLSMSCINGTPGINRFIKVMYNLCKTATQK